MILPSEQISTAFHPTRSRPQSYAWSTYSVAWQYIIMMLQFTTVPEPFNCLLVLVFWWKVGLQAVIFVSFHTCIYVISMLSDSGQSRWNHLKAPRVQTSSRVLIMYAPILAAFQFLCVANYCIAGQRQKLYPYFACENMLSCASVIPLTKKIFVVFYFSAGQFDRSEKQDRTFAAPARKCRSFSQLESRLWKVGFKIIFHFYFIEDNEYA